MKPKRAQLIVEKIRNSGGGLQFYSPCRCSLSMLGLNGIKKILLCSLDSLKFNLIFISNSTFCSILYMFCFPNKLATLRFLVTEKKKYSQSFVDSRTWLNNNFFSPFQLLTGSTSLLSLIVNLSVCLFYSPFTLYAVVQSHFFQCLLFRFPHHKRFSSS